MGHPATIAIRFEVEDAESGVPIRGVEVRLEGEYEDLTRFRSIMREFRSSAYTDSDGVAVHGLSWHTHSPYEVKIDDIEKIQRVSIRARGYRIVEEALDLSYLIGDDAGLDRLLLDTPGAEYFYLFPGPEYEHYGVEASTDPLFFEVIRDRSFDLDVAGRNINGIQVTPRNRKYPSVVPFLSNPQAEAGPYVMVPYLVRMTCQIRRGC